MRGELDFATETLRRARGSISSGDSRYKEFQEIEAARGSVIAKYQRVFSDEHLPALTADEFRRFLNFSENRHWRSLDRLGTSIVADMGQLRRALQVLADENRPIRDRLNYLVPRGRPIVSRLSRAVLTPILLIRYPDKYGVWNKVSEDGMKKVRVWPEFERGLPFGERYERVNARLNELATMLGVDLWTLDALWWRVVDDVLEHTPAEEEAGSPAVDGEGLGSGAVSPTAEPCQRFGLERYLQEFLRDNWQQTDLDAEWKLHEEDGEEVGFEYRCDVGRIDLLARHKTESRWLVIELKRGQSSDQTVGQLTKYMGWVRQKLAKEGEKVEGLIISHEADKGSDMPCRPSRTSR